MVIAFLPRNERLLISWLQSPSAVILEPKKIKSVTVAIVSPSHASPMYGIRSTGSGVYFLKRQRDADDLQGFLLLLGFFLTSFKLY